MKFLKTITLSTSLLLAFCVTSGLSAAEVNTSAVSDNMELVFGNPATRNTAFDNNEYIDTPMREIKEANHTVEGYPYKYVANPLNEPYSGLFRVKCEVSHFAYDDPIVFPNQPGRAHLHMFFGNTRANAYSTFESLMDSGAGTCNGEELNRTAYWAPAMLDAEGNALVPWDIMVYYKNTLFTLNGRNDETIPYPDNFQMISGQAGATTPQTELTGPGSDPIVTFGCGAPYGGTYTPTIPSDCTGDDSDSLQMKVAFPSCWDGDGLYKADGSHIAFPENGFWHGDCPESHPIKMPSVMYRIHYKLADNGGSTKGWFLSSDVRHDGSRKTPGMSAHADWFGAWNKEVMSKWVENCNNTAGAECIEGKIQLTPTVVSLKERKLGPYVRQKVPAAELAKLCPWKEWDGTPEGIAKCRMH